jgi:hypothetical protein
VWVEPVSGIVLRVAEQVRERSAWPGRGPVTLLDSDLSTDPASVARLAGLARHQRGRLLLLRGPAPLGAAAAGLALLGGAPWIFGGARNAQP